MNRKFELFYKMLILFFIFSTMGYTKNFYFVNLQDYYNVDGISENLAVNDGDLDGNGFSYPYEELPLSKKTFSINSEKYGRILFRGLQKEKEKKNFVSFNNQNIKIKDNKYSYIFILITAVNGDQEGILELVYNDKSFEQKQIKISDWCFSPKFGEDIAFEFSCRRNKEGKDVGPPPKMWLIKIAVNNKKKLKYIKLSKNNNLLISALTLSTHFIPDKSLIKTISYKVIALYYSGYRNPYYETGSSFGEWRIWNKSGEVPDNLCSKYFPVLGAYDSRSDELINYHIKWLLKAHIGVIGYVIDDNVNLEKDKVLPNLMDKLQKYRIKICFYFKNSNKRIVDDIKYIYKKFSKSKSLFKRRGKILIFIDAEEKDISRTLKKINRKDNILIVNKFGLKYSDGYFMNCIEDNFNNYEKIYYKYKKRCKRKRKIFVPFVSPGIDTIKIGGKEIVYRNKGKTYDKMWNVILNNRPDMVMICSFNDWAKNTMIEPASLSPPQGPPSGKYGYQNYGGHYDIFGIGSAEAYIQRTSYWIKKYDKSLVKIKN